MRGRAGLLAGRRDLDVRTHWHRREGDIPADVDSITGYDLDARRPG